MNAHGQGTILVPVDFSRESAYAIDHAVAMAKIFGYNIFLLNIISKEKKEATGSVKLKKNSSASHRKSPGILPCMFHTC